jgi:hypothetical protein
MIRQIVQLDERFYVTRDDDERFEFGVRSLHITRRERKVIAFILFVCLAVAIVKVSLIPLTFLIGAIVLIYWGLRKNADKYDCFTHRFPQRRITRRTGTKAGLPGTMTR